MDLIYLSAAMSLDGYINDTSDERLILSSPEDLADMYAARAKCDAILVGAGTIRADNPSLLLKDPQLIAHRQVQGLSPQLTKVTLTESGDLDPAAKFFTTGNAPKVVLCAAATAAATAEKLKGVAEVVSMETMDAATAIHTLEQRGIRKLFVEGGTQVLTSFLSVGMFHQLRLAIAPFFVGAASAPRFVGPADFFHNKNHRLRVAQTRVLGDMTVINLINDAFVHA